MKTARVHHAARRRGGGVAAGGTGAARRADATGRRVNEPPAADPEARAQLAAFQRGCSDAGWIVGRNVRFTSPGAAPHREQYRQKAAELVALAPDVVLGADGATAEVVHRGEPQHAGGARAVYRPGRRRRRRQPGAAGRQCHRLHAVRLMGPNPTGQYRRAAGYVDRILKGEKAGRPSSASDHKDRFCHQPQDCKGARPRGASIAAAARRRGDRVSGATSSSGGPRKG